MVTTWSREGTPGGKMCVVDVRIEPLGMHPGLVPVTAEWHFREFDPDGDVAFWTRARQAEAQFSGIPCAWVAFVGEVPVGTVSLVEHNMDTRVDLRPWLAALFVLSKYRGRGIGKSLVRRCEEEAKSLAERRLFLWTKTTEAFYVRLGWSQISRETYEGDEVAVMERNLE